MKLPKTKLCCLLNAEYKCVLCGAVVCKVCNEADLDYIKSRVPSLRTTINQYGHLKKSCITSNELACGWREVE